MEIKYSQNTLSYLCRTRRLARENWNDMTLAILKFLLLKRTTIADIAKILKRRKSSVRNAAQHIIELEREMRLK